MRVSQQVMAANHMKIIEKATLLFRENGIASTSVADVMKSAGLTHGGFYRHFRSKDKLISAAIQTAFRDFTQKLENDIKQRGAKPAITDFISAYLTEQHILNPSVGCPIASLGSEINQNFKMHRKIMAQETEQLIMLFSQGINNKSNDDDTKAIGLLAVLVGSLVMARMAETKSAMNSILSAGNTLAKSHLG